MNRPKLLDLFCGQGGASAGYVAAGFEVIGVDIDPQPRYPYEFIQADVLAFLLWTAHEYEFDAIHASPPCQQFTNAQRIMGNQHPDYISATRQLLDELGKPYVIENVPGSPLRDPVELCGEMFGLRTYRHRLFESNVPLAVPTHPEHTARTTKMGRRPVDGEYLHVVGNFSGVDLARKVMGMPWANRDGLREAVPPAYTEYLGAQLVDRIERAAA